MTSLRKLPDSFLASQVDNELILVHGNTGAFYALKDVGLAIWRTLDEEQDLDLLCERLEQEYDVAPDDCRSSVDRFAEELVSAGFAEFA